jgi:hypothetical protein
MDCVLAAMGVGAVLAVGLMEWQRRRRAALRAQLLADTRRQGRRLAAALDALRCAEGPSDD